MDITKWKSVAVRISDYKILKALCDEKFRNPASMISKLTHDYVKFRATKSKLTIEAYLKKLLKK